MGVQVDRLRLRYELPPPLAAQPRARLGAEDVVPFLRRVSAGFLPRGVYSIPRLKVRLELSPAQLSKEALLEAWSRAFFAELRAAVERPGGVDVRSWESRAAFLARLVADILAGTAQGRWEYAYLGEILALPAPAAIRAVLALDSGAALAILLAAEASGDLTRVLAVSFDDEGSCEWLFDLMEEAGTTPMRPNYEVLLAVGRAMLAQPEQERAEPRRRRYVLRLLLKLAREGVLRGDDLRSPRPVAHAVAVWSFLIEHDWPLRARGEIPVEALGRRPEVVAVLEEIRARSRAGTLGDLPEVLQALKQALPSRTLPAGRWVETRAAGVFLFTGLLLRGDWPRAIAQSPLGAKMGPRALTYSLAAIALSALGRLEPMERTLDPGLAVFAGFGEDPDVAGFHRFLAGGTDADRRALLDALLLAAGYEKEAVTSWTRTFDVLTDRLISELAGRIRGFRHSRRAFIVEHFLARPGRVLSEKASVAVVLEPSPFQVALRASGLDETFLRVSFLGDRPLAIQLEGL